MARQQSKKRGIIYIVSNDGIEGGLKIGRSGSLDSLKRRLGHWRSGSPYKYRLKYAGYADDAETIEDKLHEVHDASRMKEGGGIEWFRIDFKSAKATLDICEGLQVLSDKELAELQSEPITPPKRETKARASRRVSTTKSERRPRYSADLNRVPEGATLTYVSDSRITARVVSEDPLRVEYKGKRISLSGATGQIRGKNSGYALKRWKYNGRTIYDIKHGK